MPSATRSARLEILATGLLVVVALAAAAVALPGLIGAPRQDRDAAVQLGQDKPTVTPLPTPAQPIPPPSDFEEDVDNAMAFVANVISPTVAVQDLHIRKMSEAEWLSVIGGSSYPPDPSMFLIFAFSTFDRVGMEDFLMPLSISVPEELRASLASPTTDPNQPTLAWYYLSVWADTSRIKGFGTLFPRDLPELLTTGVVLR
jgi:hypothetical protein